MSDTTAPHPSPVIVSADDEGTPFTAHSLTGYRWNGWECPLFTTEQGKAVAAHYPDDVTYDETTDTFTEAGDETPAHTLTRDGVRLHIIGNGWTWSTVTPATPAELTYTRGHDYAEGLEIGSGEVPPADPAAPVYDADWDSDHEDEWRAGYDAYRAESIRLSEGGE